MPKWTSATAPRIEWKPRATARLDDKNNPLYEVTGTWAKLTQDVRSGGAYSIGKVEKGSRYATTAIVAVNPASLSAMLGTIKKFERYPNSQAAKDALRKVGKYLTEEVVDRMFVDQGKPGYSWPNLSPLTVALRGNAFPMLDVTGALRREATSDRAVMDIKTGANPRIVLGGEKFDTPEVYKYYMHMAGGRTSPLSKYPNRPVPARPFMPQRREDLYPEEQQHIADIFREQLDYLVKRG